jgi:hypothetical protein
MLRYPELMKVALVASNAIKVVVPSNTFRVEEIVRRWI